MDGRRKPDPQTESGTDLNDKEVIELTEIVEGGDGDDIIDLNDVIEQPDQAMETAVEPEEEAIPLVNALSEEAVTDASEAPDDEIIDLTDVTASPAAPAVAPAAESAAASGDDEVDETLIDLVDVAAAPEAGLVEPQTGVSASMSRESTGTAADEDEVIDLMDVATTLEGDTAETDVQESAATTMGTDEIAPADEPVIDLLDALEPQTAEAGMPVETDDELSELESRAEAVLTGTGDAFDVETPEEAAETAGPDSDFMIVEENQAIIGEIDDPSEAVPDVPESIAAPVVDPVPPSAPIPLTEAQIEAALARTIEKIYGEKIEQLMIRTIEKTVTREIVRIKNALLEDDDDVTG
ncbi:MAG: hypothetical protein V2I40_12675 [Desulfobacteraceae bacterium]|jgi:hypothetical protein|nr:hypothetical protein [Desulfobacteraceae bacterium]